VNVTLLYFDGCASWQTADARLTELADELDLSITRQRVTSPEHAKEIGFRGSPTILVDGRDVFAEGHEPAGLSCRVYQTPDGAAGARALAQLRDVLT
jgi:hypothetical protein